MMLLVIMICTSMGCDRIAQPIESCSNSAFAAQVILARTALYDGHQRLKISCEKIK